MFDMWLSDYHVSKTKTGLLVLDFVLFFRKRRYDEIHITMIIVGWKSGKIRRYGCEV